MVDFDGTEECERRLAAEGVDLYRDPEHAIRTALKLFFPPEFNDCSVLAQFSSSAGLKSPQDVRMHVFFWLDRPRPNGEVSNWLHTQNQALASDGVHKISKKGALGRILDTSVVGQRGAAMVCRRSCV